MLVSFSTFLEKNKKIIPLFLFLLFMGISVPGANWGVPALWNPDELIWRVDQALGGELKFDETEPDFNYPSLPKYVMYGIGTVVYGMGGGTSDFIISARVFSAILGAVAGVLIYYLALMIGMEVSISALAGLLYIASGVAAANGRFAHNDLYLQLFSILCVHFAVKYQLTKSRLWLYISFFSVGLAASSKFTGGSLLLVPLFVFIFMNWSEIRKDWLQSLEILFISGVLGFGGYGIGTPKAIFWMAYYFKRVIPALQRYPQYGFNSGSAIGLLGQWTVFKSAVGTFAYYLFICCFIWFAVKLLLWRLGKLQMGEKQAQIITILIATVLLFDLPFMVSVNYIPRYFIPFVPFLCILAAMLIKEIIDLAKSKNWDYIPSVIAVLLVVGISYSMLRLVSTALLFMNDARMPASEFVTNLPGNGKVIEYTLYPPIVNRKQFAKAYNYPIFFLKYPTDIVPKGGRYEYNQGEKGLLERKTDYLIIDTFTYSRLYTDSICDTNPVECDFFKRLLAGKVTTFHLMKEFTYSLPPWLPYVTISAVNPEIRIYERVK